MTPTYAKSTYLFGRGLGLTLLVAFVSWHVQQAGLVGDDGILPARELLELHRVRGHGFTELPSLAWWFGADTQALSAMCFVGEVAALFLLLGILPGPMSLIGAAFYLSLHGLGGPFMAFQWDLLIIETALLGALVLPWRLRHPPSAAIEPPVFARWAIYALAFRLMFLSGVVKLSSGDSAWSELRALDYHYWTQPLPNGLAWLVHQLPSGFHTVSTALVFLFELVLPCGILVALLASAIGGIARLSGRSAKIPRAAAAWSLRVTGLGTIALMVVIGLTGNYGFFNLLTGVIALPLLDDALIERLTPARLRARFTGAAPTMHVAHRVVRLAQCSLLMFIYWLGALALLMGLGAGPSLPDACHEDLVVTQPYRIANGYGLFAVMTRVRREIRIEGSLDGVTWREYAFLHKPGDPSEMPGLSAPHMPRLDWQMWFAALGSYRHNPWLGRFMRRLLEAEPSVLALLADDPFDGARPRFVRAVLWDYRFGDIAARTERGVYWEVEELGPYSPVLRAAR